MVDLDRRLWRYSFPWENSCAGRKGMEVEEGRGTRPGVNDSEEPPRGGGGREDGRGAGGGLDASSYRRRVFSSVHVGELLFERFTEGARDEVVETKAERGGESGEEREAASSDATRAGGARLTSSVAEAKYYRGVEFTKDQRRPTVTVLLPVKDGGDRLLDAVESVVACCAGEAPPDWQLELLIIDDGSRDGAVDRATCLLYTSDAADE